MGLNLLHIDTERTWRGGEQQAFLLCEGLAQTERWNVLFQTQPESPLAHRLRERGISVIENPMRGEYDLRAVWRLGSFLDEKNINLIHAHDAHAHTLAWLATMRRPDIKVVVSRRVDFPVGGNLISALKYQSKRIHYIAISNGVKEAMIRGGVPNERIDIVHSGVDPRRFEGIRKGMVFRKEYGIQEDEIFIGNVAALTDHKGQIYLIEAAPYVLERFPRARFLIMGEGELRPLLQRKIQELNLKGKVVLTGHISNIGEAYASMDLFALSSHLEGLCTAVVDAMLMGVPVVATRTGGVPDVVLDGECGLLAQPRNPKALGECIVRLLSDKDMQSRFIERGKARVQELFTAEKMIQGTIKVYEKLLRQG
ncbi:MAG TPA: glycosyltransferase [Candidatus Sumerlaeia bacterium]|nr:glycosyltransferase [Candidatus Sumerlaeia bacterium]